MELSSLYLVVLATSITCLFAQVMVKNKQLSHILFAIFCSSIALTVTKKLSGDTIGAYQYLVGMAACATCNCFWLFSRTLFRRRKPIEVQHVVVAVAIALLIMLNQGYLFVIQQWQIPAQDLKLGKSLLSEATVMLSSCILVLTFWEGCRGFKSSSKVEKQQRAFFLATFATALTISKVVKGNADNPVEVKEWVITSITLIMILFSQYLLFWKAKVEKSVAIQEQENQQTVHTIEVSSSVQTEPVNQEQVEAVTELLIQQQWFLQPNLKVGDLAKALDVPEYKVSKIIRNHLNARNFNHYVNQLRIEHAKGLLKDPEKHQWPVLVVGLESGFASVGPFSRAFKDFTGYTPNQYRKNKTVSGTNIH